MNRLEAFVYKQVKNNYILKDFLRNAYQGFYDLLPNYESKFANEPIVLEDCYFGFHDACPFSKDNSKILSNRLTIPLRMPTEQDALEVGYWTGKDFSQWVKVGETCAWNYHKGCRLQWVNKHLVIYNVCDNGVLKSRVHDIETGGEETIGWAIDTVSGDGKQAASFSYGRLQEMMPGYGYVTGDDDAHLDKMTAKDTGLYLVNLENNSRELLVDLQTLSELHPEEGMDDTYHFVTHTEFSADSRYLAFLHRWYKGTFQRTRLIVMDLRTRQMYISPTTGMVSHYAWNSKNGIIAYCRVEDIDSHVYFNDPTMRTYKRCGYPQLNSDGHQHFIDDGHFLVDTYPDKYRHAKLYRVDVETDEVVLLADVKSPKKFVSPNDHKNWKCDLHPRCSADGTLASFDSVHTGTRSLCVMKIDGKDKSLLR